MTLCTKPKFAKLAFEMLLYKIVVIGMNTTLVANEGFAINFVLIMNMGIWLFTIFT